MPPGLAQEDPAPDEAAVTARFIAFLLEASKKRYPTGVIRRFNQGRHTGCVDATFSIAADVPQDLRIGLFAEPRTFRARIRFANAASSSDRERDVRGMSLKLFDVPGENLMPGSTTQDFVLNSHPVMLAPGPREFLALMQAVEAAGFDQVRYFATHPRSAIVAAAARRHHSSHLDISYWSTTPYLFGPGRAVKYLARPSSSRRSAMPARLTDTYLREAMAAHLANASASFDFMIQLQTDSGRMPIEDAMIEWSERESPYQTLARIEIPPQRIDDPEREQFCERVSFNPWNCLPDHRPLGAMNRARRDIYAALSRLRHARSELIT